MLAWENEQDFVDLHDSVRQELNPVGSLDIAVLDIARLHWVKRRLNVGAQLAYHRHPDAAPMIKAGEEGWQGVRNYLRDKASHTDTGGYAHPRFFQRTTGRAKRVTSIDQEEDGANVLCIEQV